MEPDGARRPNYTAEQFAPLFAAQRRHFWFLSRNRCIAAAIRSLPNFTVMRDVLEVGCGSGVVLAQLQKLLPAGRLVGIDLFEEGLRLAGQHFQGTLIKGDIFDLSFEQRFDLIGAFDVIEHLDEDEKLLRHLKHHLRPGGHLIVTVPAHQRLWSYFDEVACHRRRYAPAELRRKLSAAGFRELFVTQFMAALLPLLWVKRRLLGQGPRKLSRGGSEEKQAAAESDLRIYLPVNCLLQGLLRPEAYFISHRLRLPFGTSVLAIATRPEEGSNKA